MSTNALTSLLGINFHPFTGKVEAIRVCAHCEKEGDERAFVAAFAKRMNSAPVSHGICPTHFQGEMDKLRLDSPALDPILTA